MGVPQNERYLFVVPIIRIIACRGLYWGPLFRERTKWSPWNVSEPSTSQVTCVSDSILSGHSFRTRNSRIPSFQVVEGKLLGYRITGPPKYVE